MVVLRNFGKLTLCSIAMFFVFVGYATTKAIISKIFKDNGFGSLGFYV